LPRRAGLFRTAASRMTPSPTQTPVKAAGAPATQRFGQFYWVCGRAVLLFVAIDLLLRAVLGVVPGTTAIISLFVPPTASAREHAAMGCVFSGGERRTP
jgi:hypothetical protein